MTDKWNYTGMPAKRVDGRAKVTGAARYAGEFDARDLLYGHVLSSPVTKGRLVMIDTKQAEALEGVVKVFTHENTPRLAWLDRSYRDQVAPDGSPLRPLHDDEILFNGQPVALVVAVTEELAVYACSLIRMGFGEEPHSTDLDAERMHAVKAPASRSGIELPPEPRGDPDEVYFEAGKSFHGRYETAPQHHHPMEIFATTAIWDGKVLNVHDKTQGVLNTQKYLCKVFGISKDKLRVISPYVGGAFGSALRPQYQCFMAVLAATELERDVRVSLTRQQMSTLSGRSRTLQSVKLGATLTGDLKAVIHECLSETSTFEDYIENIVNWSGTLYECEHVRQGYEIARLDMNTPCDMRAPGATQGVFAFECAVDEMAAALEMDPLEFRMRNHAEKDQAKGLPFSSNELMECYRQGAEAFGWKDRPVAAGAMREGRLSKGWGMATGVWEAMQMPASAKAVLKVDGSVVVSSATSDIGTGTYTIMTQIAAETLGLPLSSVDFKLGDTTLPMSPLQGGSWTAASVGTAVQKVCAEIREKLFKKAVKHPVFEGLEKEELALSKGSCIQATDPSRHIALARLMRELEIEEIEATSMALPEVFKQKKFTMQSHSAVFAEVVVDDDTRMVRVTRVVSAIAGGKILNPKTARSQILGGVVWGIGAALQEETLYDHGLGKIMSRTLADYHFPAHADIGEIEVIFVEEKDEVVNPLGVKGLGEIGIVGVAAAIANAVYHATGKRVRNLPITPDKLVGE